MKIEFDTTDPTEATAIRALLDVLHPVNPYDYVAGIIDPKGSSHDLGYTPRIDPTTPPATFRIDAPRGEDGPVGGPREQQVSDIVQLPTTDANDEPHDSRIHATPPTINKDGTWRAKRGVTAEQIAEVRAERDAGRPALDVALEQGDAVNLAEETVEEHIAEVAEVAASAPPAPPSSAAVEVNNGPPTVVPPPAPPAPQAPTDAAPSFLDIMKLVTPAQSSGKLTAAQVKEMCEAVGAATGIMGLNGADNGDKRVAFKAMLDEVLV